MERVFKIVDADGEWVLNPHSYAFTDPSTGQRFDPNMPVKIKASDWMTGQMEAGVLVKTDDHEKATAAQREQEAADAAAAAAAQAAAQAAAEAADKAAAEKASKSGKR